MFAETWGFVSLNMSRDGLIKKCPYDNINISESTMTVLHWIRGDIRWVLLILLQKNI